MQRSLLRIKSSTKLVSEKWNFFKEIIESLQKENLRFSVGGGLASAAYSNRWKEPKDLDIYCLLEDRDRIVFHLMQLNFSDYYDKRPYDKTWIFRATKDEKIVDVIWRMANIPIYIDLSWLDRSNFFILDNVVVPVVPVEELVWSKLYVLQSDRSDWPDILNILYWSGLQFDWPHLFHILGPDIFLLQGALAVFSWIAPAKARLFPSWIWAKAGLKKPNFDNVDIDEYERARQLDSRDWFGPKDCGASR